MYFFRATITDASFSFSVHKNLNRWKNSPPFFPTIFQLKLCFFMLFYAFPIKKKPLKRIDFQWFALFCITYQRRKGDSNPRYPNRVRQFSKLLVSATHPSLQGLAKKHLCSFKTECKSNHKTYKSKLFQSF